MQNWKETNVWSEKRQLQIGAPINRNLHLPYEYIKQMQLAKMLYAITNMLQTISCILSCVKYIVRCMEHCVRLHRRTRAHVNKKAACKQCDRFKAKYCADLYFFFNFLIMNMQQSSIDLLWSFLLLNNSCVTILFSFRQRWF